MQDAIAPLFPAEPWSLSIDRLDPQQQMLAETLLSLANGYIGTRGTFEEPLDGQIASCEGTYLNGVYQREPITYGESAYGFASHNQKMLQVPNGKRLELLADGELLQASEQQPGQRVLDMKNGVLIRRQQFITASGQRLSLVSRRFVSLADSQLMAIDWQLTADDSDMTVELWSWLDAAYRFNVNKDDPRVGQLSIEDALSVQQAQQQDRLQWMQHSVKGSDFQVASACLTEVDGELVSQRNIDDKQLAQCFRLTLPAGKTVRLTKWVAYGHSEHGQAPDIVSWLKTAASKGFAAQLAAHQQCWQQFWDGADLTLVGDDALQQGLRFNQFHLFQSAGRNGRASIGAKGLTGHGYDGHYFWDSEIYVVPSLAISQPAVARKMLEYRIHTLPAARQRAIEMSHDSGALYAWRTIGGEECSAYFPAGTAQYHINAAVAYGFKTYLTATGDLDLLWQGGAEVVMETARLWRQLGHFNPRKGNQFCIDGVTGPDEYTAIVSNNFYTNAMARMHLSFAAELSQRLAADNPLAWQELVAKLVLTDEEVRDWQYTAEHMYLPFDEQRGIHKQDDSFLDKAPWDFANTPKDHYPLLLHYHPLVIYRHQVLKQADVVLAMYLLDDAFSREQKARNLTYYEPLTTHDSTLSSCIHAIEFAEVGQLERAYAFFYDTVRMDLDNHHGNTEYGVHIACMAGSLASVVNGFGGLRLRADGPHFHPRLPAQWQQLTFKVHYAGRVIRFSAEGDKASYQLVSGQPLTVFHHGQPLALGAQPVTLPLEAK